MAFAAKAVAHGVVGGGRWARRLDWTGQGVVRIVASGLASLAGGGKFKNGAMTAAFAYAFNELRHRAVDYSDCGDGKACVVKNEGVRTEAEKLNSALQEHTDGRMSVSGGDRYYDEAAGGSISHSTGEFVDETIGFHNDQNNNRALDIRFSETGLTGKEVIPFIQKHSGFKVLHNKNYPDGISTRGHIHLTCNTKSCIN